MDIKNIFNKKPILKQVSFLLPSSFGALVPVNGIVVDYNEKYRFAEISGNSSSLYELARAFLWLAVKGCVGDGIKICENLSLVLVSHEGDLTPNKDFCISETRIGESTVCFDIIDSNETGYFGFRYPLGEDTYLFGEYENGVVTIRASKSGFSMLAECAVMLGDSKIDGAHEHFDELGSADKGSIEIVIMNNDITE